jgi:hypothetical protein
VGAAMNVAGSGFIEPVDEGGGEMRRGLSDQR